MHWDTRAATRAGLATLLFGLLAAAQAKAQTKPFALQFGVERRAMAPPEQVPKIQHHESRYEGTPVRHGFLTL